MRTYSRQGRLLFTAWLWIFDFFELAIPASSSIFMSSTMLKHVPNKISPMIEFEPRTFGTGSKRLTTESQPLHNIGLFVYCSPINNTITKRFRTNFELKWQTRGWCARDSNPADRRMLGTDESSEVRRTSYYFSVNLFSLPCYSNESTWLSLFSSNALS